MKPSLPSLKSTTTKYSWQNVLYTAAFNNKKCEGPLFEFAELQKQSVTKDDGLMYIGFSLYLLHFSCIHVFSRWCCCCCCFSLRIQNQRSGHFCFFFNLVSIRINKQTRSIDSCSDLTDQSLFFLNYFCRYSSCFSPAYFF